MDNGADQKLAAEVVRRVPEEASPMKRGLHRPISRTAHGVLDYVYGLLLIVSPWLFRFSQQRQDTQIAVIMGVAVIVYSVLTNYELGVIRLFPFAVHLVLDLLIAILLLGAWIHFGSLNRAGIVFAVFGVIALAVLALTRPGDARGAALN